MLFCLASQPFLISSGDTYYCIYQGYFALAEMLCSAVSCAGVQGSFALAATVLSTALCPMETKTRVTFGKTGITFRSVLRFGSIFYSREKTKFFTYNQTALPFGVDLKKFKKIGKKEF